MIKTGKFYFSRNIVIILSLFFLSCGLESDIPTLHPPEFVSLISTEIKFKATSLNSEPEFIGFELYYKIYGIDEDIETDLKDVNDLGNKGFSRVYSEDDTKYKYEKPLIFVPIDNRGDEFVIVIHIIFDPEPYISFLGSEFEIRSAISEQETYYYEPFSDVINDEGGNVKILFYTFSYGKSIEDFVTPVYSDLVRLGHVEVAL